MTVKQTVDAPLIVNFMTRKISKSQKQVQIIFQQQYFVPKAEMSAFIIAATLVSRYAVAQLVKALRYKPGSISDGVIGIFL
jgi:hypothetical protein